MFPHHFSPAFRSALTSLFSACFSNFSRENWGFILSTSATAEALLPAGSRQTETIPPISLGVLRCETTNDIMLSNNCIDQDLVMQLSNCGHDKKPTASHREIFLQYQTQLQSCTEKCARLPCFLCINDIACHLSPA